MATKKPDRPAMSDKVRREASDALRGKKLPKAKSQSLGGGALRQTEPRKITKKKP